MNKNQGECEVEDHTWLHVAHDPLLGKHPLEHAWTLWYYKDKTGCLWKECHTEIASFDTVEDFWALYHHLNPPSEMKNNCDYSMFRKGIQPMWEDERNWDGGRWLFTIREMNDSRKLDDIWMEVLILLIGEAFGDNSEEVCGCVVSIRKKADKIGIWTTDASKKDSVLEIGKICKVALKESHNLSVHWEYRSHSIQRRRGAYLCNLYTL